jgi:ferritin-like protein
MRELATLRMDTGREVRVEVIREDAEHDEIVVRRTTEFGTAPTRDLIAVIDAHLPTATRHPAGTTDRLLAADRDRPY